MLTTSQKPIDFGKFHAALNGAKLTQSQGSVVKVSGLVVESNGPVLGLGELCSIHLRNGNKAMAEVIGFSNKNLLLLPLDHIDGISPGDAVTAKFAPRYITLGERILGRILNGLGEPIDGAGTLKGMDKRRLDSQAVAPLDRKKITEALSLGIRSIDSMLSLGKGQRVGIFAGSGVGKSVLLGDIANSTEADVNVVALIGERGREVREFIEENLEAKVWLGVL